MARYKDLNDYEVMYLIEEHNEDARELLFDKYKPIVIKIASQYKNQAKKYGLEIEDLIQEGYLGLYSAVETYDTNNNVLFYTYAIISIRSKILNSLTLKSAGKHKGLNQSVSLSSQISNEDDGILMDILEDKNALSPHLMIEINEMEHIIRDFLWSLDFSHSLIFELKMNGFKNRDIVELLDIPLKYVSNVLFRIRIKLRDYLRDF